MDISLFFYFMEEKDMNGIKSRFAECKPYYYANDVCRIVDPKQNYLYMKNGLYPVDMYCSGDVIVYVYDKKSSYECYKKWCDRTLQ